MQRKLSSRIALGIEYSGSAYNGWQRQPHAPSVQEQVERALSSVAAHDVTVICAGRTDTGVHATEQVVHFDSPAQRRTRAWVLGTNSHLPRDITVRWAGEVDDSFHARFSARQRGYRYVIDNRPVRPGILDGKVTWVHEPLDASLMHESAQVLTGTNDFSSYRALGCQAKSPVRTVSSIAVVREGDFIYLDVVANAFLHHMIRNIAGVLIAVGSGKRPADWTKTVLAKRDRTQGGVTAPPHGLYLTAVTYPEQYHLPPSPRSIVF